MFEEFLNCGKALGIEHLVGYLQNSNTEDNNYDITQQQQTPTNTFTELSEENNENESKKAPLDNPETKEPIICSVCGMSFSEQKYLKGHVKSKHGKN